MQYYPIPMKKKVLRVTAIKEMKKERRKNGQDVVRNVLKMWVAHLVMHVIPNRMNWHYG